MNEPTPNELAKSRAEADRQRKIDAVSPTWRMLVDEFGEAGLMVETRPHGIVVQGTVLADGTVWPKGIASYKPCRPEFTDWQNRIRYSKFCEMMRPRRRLQGEEVVRRDEETEHKVWIDSDGVKRVAPAEHEELQRKKDEGRKRR